MKEKVCLRCKTSQPIGVFCKSARNKDGKDNYCRKCKRDMNQGYVTNPENKEKIREAKRKYHRKPETKLRDREYRRTDRVKKKRRENDNKTPRHIFHATLRLALRRAPPVGLPPMTVQELMDLWRTQEGLCAISGLKMTWGNGQSWKASPHSISMDRIDPDKGYGLGNIRLVCTAINMFRGQMADDKMVEMARAIVAKADDSGPSWRGFGYSAPIETFTVN